MLSLAAAAVGGYSLREAQTHADYRELWRTDVSPSRAYMWPFHEQLGADTIVLAGERAVLLSAHTGEISRRFDPPPDTDELITVRPLESGGTLLLARQDGRVSAVVVAHLEEGAEEPTLVRGGKEAPTVGWLFWARGWGACVGTATEAGEEDEPTNPRVELCPIYIERPPDLSFAWEDFDPEQTWLSRHTLWRGVARQAARAGEGFVISGELRDEHEGPGSPPYEGILARFTLEGEELWRQTWTPREGSLGPLSVVGEQVCSSFGEAGPIRCLGLEDGAPRWELDSEALALGSEGGQLLVARAEPDHRFEVCRYTDSGAALGCAKVYSRHDAREFNSWVPLAFGPDGSLYLTESNSDSALMRMIPVRE